MDNEYGSLFVCATPIGNLKDITLRALETLKTCDYIAAEDTRHTLKLLNHYGIKNRLISYHHHNQGKRGEELIALLKNGNSIALVSDAGMPGISDPGADIIKQCYENAINVTICPGASASLSAMVLSGYAGSFVFEGFLPAKKKERQAKYEELKKEKRAIIIYEGPHRLKSALNDMLFHLGDRDIAIVREITKIHEEVIRLKISEAINIYKDKAPKGEYVLVIKAKEPDVDNEDAIQFWCGMSSEEHVAYYENAGLKGMDAIKKAAKDRGVPKSEVYNCVKNKKRV